MLTESTTETMTQEKVVLCQHFCLGNMGFFPTGFLFHPATIM
jgi:hypothetical protein